jgi:flagellar assembly protein FliH
LTQKLQHLEELLQSFERLKADLIACNEAQIVRLTYYMAKRLVYDEISARPEVVIEAVRQALMAAQSDENVTVRVSPSDLAFIDGIKEKLGKEFDNVKRLKFEAGNDVSSGGCVVETNYGDVNATLEQRLSRVWQQLNEKLPKPSDVMSAVSDDNSGEGHT